MKASNRARCKIALQTTACAIVILVSPQTAFGQDLPTATLLAEFKSMCLSTNATGSAALSEADRLHWKAVSPSRYTVGTETAIVARANGTQLLLLSEKVSHISGLPIKARSCTVMATVDDPNAAIAFAESLVGRVKPNMADQLGRQWIYAQTNDGPVEIKTNAFASEAIRSGRYRELLVSDQQTGQLPGGNTALEYTVGVAP